MFGLTSATHLETTGDHGNLHRVSSAVTLIYNNLFCWYRTPHGDVISFRTRAYSKTLNADTKSIHESFLNDDCATTAGGFYTIMIDQTNEGTTFQVASPTGTIIAQNAKRISQNGPVPAGTMKIDWTAVRREQEKTDSAVAARQTVQQYRQDSIKADRQVEARRHDSLLAVAKRMKIFIGSGNPDDHWLESVIASKKADSARTTH